MLHFSLKEWKVWLLKDKNILLPAPTHPRSHTALVPLGTHSVQHSICHFKSQQTWGCRVSALAEVPAENRRKEHSARILKAVYWRDCLTDVGADWENSHGRVKHPGASVSGKLLLLWSLSSKRRDYGSLSGRRWRRAVAKEVWQWRCSHCWNWDTSGDRAGAG